MELLAGDIGGTNTRLALYRAHGATFAPLAEQIYPSQAYTSLQDILQKFLQQTGRSVQRACFGIAGPVINQTCEATNLPWSISAAEIAQQFGFEHTWLLNDLEANAWGIDTLSHTDFHILNPGCAEPHGNASIISAGTGLGEAGLYWDGQLHRPFPSEGGHTDFSPANELEFALHAHLAQRHGHVSWERVVSGPGIEAIHRFLRVYRAVPAPDWLQEKIRTDGGAPSITHAALQLTDTVCTETLDIFSRLYAREAGNHALKIMASGGVYLGGGIAPKILQRLSQPDFLQSFFAKGRMRHLMEAMPVKVILNDKAALLGAAHFAAVQ